MVQNNNYNKKKNKNKKKEKNIKFYIAPIHLSNK